MNWVEIGAAFLTGGGLQYALNYVVAKKNASRDDFSKIVETWQKDNDRLRQENERLETQLNKIQLELNDLRSKVILMESAHSDAPLPMWLKDTKGLMLSVNKAYEEQFLLPLHKTSADYIGNSDFAIWPKEIASEYQLNDAEVLKTGKPWRGIESVMLSDGSFEKWHILKYVRYAGNIKLGVAGIAIPINWK